MTTETKRARRIVWIATDQGKYYESHEEFEGGAWCGIDFFDLTDSDAAERARSRGLEVDVSNVVLPDGSGEPIASGILHPPTYGKLFRVTIDWEKTQSGTYEPVIHTEDGSDFIENDCDVRNSSGWVIVAAQDEAEAIDLACRRVGIDPQN